MTDETKNTEATTTPPAEDKPSKKEEKATPEEGSVMEARGKVANVLKTLQNILNNVTENSEQAAGIRVRIGSAIGQLTDASNGH